MCNFITLFFAFLGRGRARFLSILNQAGPIYVGDYGFFFFPNMLMSAKLLVDQLTIFVVCLSVCLAEGLKCI